MAIHWEPLPYMRDAVKWLLERASAGLFADPGCRKTSITYAAITALKTEGLLKGALVVAPRRPAQMVWPAEREKWLQFNHLEVVLLHGPKKDKLAAKPADVYVVTYDGLKWLITSGALGRMISEGRVCTVVFDELSKMKTTSSERFKVIKPWLPRFQRRWGLTGSPASNSLLDLFGEIYALDCGKAFGQYITHFKSAFFTPVMKHPNDPYPIWQPKAAGEEAIYARLRDTVLRIDGRDHLDLPKLVYINHTFALSAAERKQYDAFERDMLLTLPDGVIFTAKTAAAASQKCRQFTSGALYHDPVDPLTGIPNRDGARKWSATQSGKLELLKELIESLQGQQLLVAYEFVHEFERIKEALGYDVPCIGGHTTDKQAAEYECAWNAGELQVLLGHPGSMGHGLNLQASNARHVCWFSGTWNFEYYEQFIGRLKRSGNTASNVFVHHLVASGTIDESVVATAQRKRKGQMTLLDALKADHLTLGA